MEIRKSFKYYFQLITEKSAFYKAFLISIILAFIFTLIYSLNWDSFLMDKVFIYRIFLSFIIPFIIILFSSVISKFNLKPGNISHIDALLRCTNCNKTDFHVHVGQDLEECPMCKKNTKWKAKQIFSIAKSDNELLKSLALFARHNPQPLLRVDAHGIINSSNPASEILFNDKALSGQNIKDLLPELNSFDFNQIILNDEVKEIIISLQGEFYNLVLKGVSSIRTINIYGNDITQIKLAEQKIKTQAKDIQESISYAWSIQKAMLPHEEFIEKTIPSHFILYRPRNVVSGDFYWINTVNQFKIVAAADSTGHGVPGAFMSMLGISILNEIILREKITEPDIILNQLRERIIASLETGKQERTVQDGMDIALIVMNTEDNTLAYSGAFNSLLILRNNEIETIKADSMPVGKHVNDQVPFSVQKVKLVSNDRIYLFTDGFKDQFGGEKDKKYGMKAFKNFIIESGSLPLNHQLKAFEKEFDIWKDGYDQVDDVLVIGIEIK